MQADAHEHNWVPLIGWVGRYQCSGCDAIGYKGVAVLEQSVHSDGYKTKIHAYLCKGRRDGAPCGRPATVAARKRQLCWEHETKRRERRR